MIRLNNLTDTKSWLVPGKAFPPECAVNRLNNYRANKMLFEDKHANVYEQQFKRIERVIGNFNDVISYVTIMNYQRLLSVKTADLVFGEPPIITVSDDNIQKEIDSILIDTDFWHYMYMSCVDISRYGDSIIMHSSKGELNVVPPAVWFPIVDTYDIRKFKYHVFCTVYIVNAEKEQYGLHTQIHNPNEPGKCDEQDYLLEGSPGAFVIGKPIKMKKDISVETMLKTCPVYRVSNMLTSDRLFGIDDYRSVDSLISELAVRVSQISKVLDKHAAPSMSGPSTALTRDERTGEYQLRLGDYFEVNDSSGIKPEYITWDASLEASFKQIDLLINQLYTISEMGSAMFGDLSNKTGDVPSGSALRRLMMSPLAKARRIANRFDPVIKNLMSALLKIHGIEIKASDITITWNDGLPADPAEDAEIANVRTGGKATLSQYTAIQRLDGMSPTDADSELAMIRSDDIDTTAGTEEPVLEPESLEVKQ